MSTKRTPDATSPTPATEAEVLLALAALAHPVRLKIFRALVVTGPAGLTPSTMAEGLGMAPSALSFHLKELTRAGLVASARASRHLIYRAAFDRMNAVLGYLTDHCCAGQACAVSPALACGAAA